MIPGTRVPTITPPPLRGVLHARGPGRAKVGAAGAARSRDLGRSPAPLGRGAPLEPAGAGCCGFSRGLSAPPPGGLRPPSRPPGAAVTHRVPPARGAPRPRCRSGCRPCGTSPLAGNVPIDVRPVAWCHPRVTRTTPPVFPICRAGGAERSGVRPGTAPRLVYPDDPHSPRRRPACRPLHEDPHLVPPPNRRRMVAGGRRRRGGGAAAAAQARGGRPCPSTAGSGRAAAADGGPGRRLAAGRTGHPTAGSPLGRCKTAGLRPAGRGRRRSTSLGPPPRSCTAERPRASCRPSYQATHDLGVSAMYPAVCCGTTRPRLARWIGEDRLAPYRRRQKLPDAVLGGRTGRRAGVGVGVRRGRTTNGASTAFHRDCARRGLAYEVW